MTCGTMFFGQAKPKWRSVAIIHSAMFGENTIAYLHKRLIPTENYSGGSGGKTFMVMIFKIF